VALFTDAHTPDATDSSYTGLTGEVANGNGYTTGGAALGSVTWGQTSGTATFDAADASWSAATFTARYAIIYDATSAGIELVCLFNFGADKIVTASTFLLTFNASGIFTLA